MARLGAGSSGIRSISDSLNVFKKSGVWGLPETCRSFGVRETSFRHVGMQQRRIIRKCILTE